MSEYNDQLSAGAWWVNRMECISHIFSVSINFLSKDEILKEHHLIPHDKIFYMLRLASRQVSNL